MLRFPNPGSDIDSFIRIYQELFSALYQKASFDLDDMSATLVERNLATSSGYMGQEALMRSTRRDRSRDPLYNQSKMYSELYKILGWFHPVGGRALEFKFTYLGAHVAVAYRDPSAIFKESILGVVYPNEILDVKGDFALRPFATILKTLEALDGKICRDEMIVGPLCLEDDRDVQSFSRMIQELRDIRGNWNKLDKKLRELSRARGIARNTMQNYTRFPLAVIKWAGWVKGERRKDIYGRAIPFLILTDTGREVLNVLKNNRDFRATELDSLAPSVREAVVRVSFYQMLERAGFDTLSLNEQMMVDLAKVQVVLGNKQGFIFSPFQEIVADWMFGLFPDIYDSGKDEQNAQALNSPEKDVVKDNNQLPEATLLHFSVPVSLTSETSVIDNSEDDETTNEFKDALIGTNSFDQAIDLLFKKYGTTNQNEFYPLVARLFRVLGYACEHSRPGVNYQRWDAFIIDSENSIPIEIKSPGEEEFLSVKAVRQALENKIILLARKPYPTQRLTTSLVVGYKLPNDRSDVISLIGDIYKAYEIRIGVVDFYSLLYLAGAKILRGKKHDREKLVNLYGIIEISDT